MFKIKNKPKSPDVVKQMDEVLGKPPVPQNSVSRVAFNKQEDELLTMRVKLQQKEHMIAEREKSLRKETKNLESEINDLKKVRSNIWDELDSLRTERIRLSEESQVLRQEIKDHKMQIREAKQSSEFVKKKQAAFEEREFKLKSREQAIGAKEKELSAIEYQIRQKQNDFARVTKIIQVEKESFEKAKQVLLNDIDVLSKKKIMLEANISELTTEYSTEKKRLEQAMHDVKELYAVAEKKNQAIDRRAMTVEKDLDQKQKLAVGDIVKLQKESNLREEHLIKFSLDLDKRELELKSWQEEVAHEKARIDLAKKEQENVRKSIVELTTEERMVEQRIAEKRKQFDNLLIDYNNKVTELKQDTQMLQEKEDEVVSKVKDLEDEEKALKKRQEEFIEEIDELEKDRLLFDKKVEQFSKKIDLATRTDKDFNQRQNALKEWEVQLEEKEQKIHKNAEYKLKTSLLKSELASLEKELKRLQPKVTKAQDIEKKFTLREKKIQEREAMLGEKEMLIKNMVLDLSDERSKLSSSEFAAYFEKELETNELANKEETVYKAVEMVSETNPNNYSLLTLLEQARQALVAHDVEKARSIYAKLNDAYKKLPSNEGKRKLYYEILELKTDIELTAV